MYSKNEFILDFKKKKNKKKKHKMTKKKQNKLNQVIFFQEVETDQPASYVLI